MKETNALFLFCEGPHDVAFCYLVLKYYFKLSTVQQKFSQYPAPLHTMLPHNLGKHIAKDLTLDMAHKFFLPDRTLTDDNDEIFVLLFNIGGKQKLENPQQFLSDFLPLYNEVEVFATDTDRLLKDMYYLFLFDADHETKESVFTTCHNSLKQINGIDFIDEAFAPFAGNDCAAMSANKAVYILGDPASGKGTLENILLPVYQANQANQGDWLDKSKQFVDDCFEWKTEHDNEQRKVAERAKRVKAIITSAGQGKKPGRPMTAIINDDVLGSKHQFLESKPVQMFANFIADFASIKKEVGQE